MVEDQRHLGPVRLLVIYDEEQFPEEFRDVLEIKVLGYRETEGVLLGALRRILKPIWTLVPKDPQLSLDLRPPMTGPELEAWIDVTELVCFGTAAANPDEPHRQVLRDHWRRQYQRRFEPPGRIPTEQRETEDDRG